MQTPGSFAKGGDRLFVPISISMRVVVLVLFLTLAASAQDLSWFTGSWGNESTEEVWSTDIDGNLMGYNRALKDGKVVFFEHLRIESKGGKTVYQACPLGKVWTPFELTKSGKNEAVFTNPKHDFPQRIHYRRQGKKMIVTISGEGQKSVTWTFALTK